MLVLLMRSNLDSLRAEIQEYLNSRGIVVFYSFPRVGETNSEVYWDIAGHPDYHEFVAAAEAAGVRMLTLSSSQLEEELIEDAMERLADATLERDVYLASRAYILDLRTDWFDDLNDLIDRLDDAVEDDDEDEDHAPGGGYFSRN